MSCEMVDYERHSCVLYIALFIGSFVPLDLLGFFLELCLRILTHPIHLIDSFRPLWLISSLLENCITLPS